MEKNFRATPAYVLDGEAEGLVGIQGERNLSADSSKKIAKAFGLDDVRTLFFEFLVGFNQAKDSEVKSAFANKILNLLKSKLNIKNIHSDQFAYYSDWIHVAIRELLIICDHLNSAQIAKLLPPTQSVEKVELSLKLLQNLDLIHKNSDRWIIKNANVSTGDSFSSAAVFDFHKKMIELGKKSLDQYGKHERNITATTVGISEISYQKITKKISDLRNEILAIADLDKKKNQVYQFNFQLFPISKKINTEDLS